MNHNLSPLAEAYLGAILVAQHEERARADRHKAIDTDCGNGHCRTVTLPSLNHIENMDPDPALTEEEIVQLATERGLAEILHICTMPASRSTKIPLGWGGPTDSMDLDPATGPHNAIRAVRGHVPHGPRKM